MTADHQARRSMFLSRMRYAVIVFFIRNIIVIVDLLIERGNEPPIAYGPRTTLYYNYNAYAVYVLPTYTVDT
jgi:hypothetical protein